MEPWYRLAVGIVQPVVRLLFRRDFRHQDRIPSSGGCIVAVNHISYVDFAVTAVFVHESGRRPRFLGKASVFRVPVTGRIIRGARQIPVYRDTADAAQALTAAVEAVRAGECVVIYPEGTITRDPDYWPMVGKTGAARLALTTGAPVIPAAQWGAQRLLGHSGRLRLGWRRTPVIMLAGERVDLRRWEGRELTADTLREATDAIMRDLRALLAEIRDENPPVEFAPAEAGVDGAPGRTA
ncbi:MAG TPA: lysophospholipid acyltransferase family protein [Mycobacteriales bacterium]|nr:lysophospholipid acyltransferase family protein [Mycobacteriales bacterium]